MHTIVEPELLRWGRRSAGVEVDDAARRIGVSPEKVGAWESGDGTPTIRQLRLLAKVYHRPLSVFFLSTPPEEAEPDIHDFRQLPGTIPGAMSAALTWQLRRAQERRQIVLELLGSLDQPLVSFGLEVNWATNPDPEEVGDEARTTLGVSLDLQGRWHDQYRALNGWRDLLESAGLLVFQASGVDLSEMRGFSLAERPLPLVVVNSKDTPRGRIFSMLHELAHVALQRSGLCEPDEGRARPPEEQRIEVFCNHVAGAALIPMDDLLQDEDVRGRQRSTDWSDYEIAAIGRRFNASRFVALRRLVIANLTTEAFYRAKHAEWLSQLSGQSGGFSSPDRKSVAENGKTFVRLVLQSYREKKITLDDVSQFLNVRLKHLPNIEQIVS